MATVNILQPAFGIKWAQDGTVEAIDEAQWRAGWSFIGATPPSVEQFNKVHQVQDEKSNYLYAQMAAIYAAAGETPSAGDLTSLRDALAAIYGGGRLIAVRVFTASGTYTPTAGTKAVRVTLQGGGGGGGGAPAAGAGVVSVGVGGGAGALAVGFLTSGFSGAAMVVGAGGAGVSGANGANGSASSFGGAGFLAGGGVGGSANGPSAPPLLSGNNNTAGAVGGYLNLPGNQGGTANVTTTSAGLSGAGANSLNGAGGGSAAGSANGAPGMGYGSGGGGAVGVSGSVVRVGGNGMPGIIIIEEFA